MSTLRRAVDVSWYRDLYKIGWVAGATAVAWRVTLAVGVPLVGGVLAGHPVARVAGGATALFVTMSAIGTTPCAQLATMLAGWVAIVGGGTLGHAQPPAVDAPRGGEALW